MGFFDQIVEGGNVFIDSVLFILEKPVFLLPIFCSWIVVASVTLYSYYYFPVLSNFYAVLALLYFLVFIISFSILFANTVMLELIEQLESGEEPSFSKALSETVSFDLVKLIPIALVWSIVWLFLMILRAASSKKRGRRREKPSMRSAARQLSGMNSPFSLLGLGLEMLEKVVRMVVFMALPAVAWENEGPLSAFKKSFGALKKHLTQFTTSYSLTFAAGIVMALPLLPIAIYDEAGVVFPEWVWMAVIIYSGFTWTFGIYLEQMSVAVLYLWHIKWLRAGGQGELSDVEKPDLLDRFYDLKPQP